MWRRRLLVEVCITWKKSWNYELCANSAMLDTWMGMTLSLCGIALCVQSKIS
jgi:hypothetical protein